MGKPRTPANYSKLPGSMDSGYSTFSTSYTLTRILKSPTLHSTEIRWEAISLFLFLFAVGRWTKSFCCCVSHCFTQVSLTTYQRKRLTPLYFRILSFKEAIGDKVNRNNSLIHPGKLFLVRRLITWVRKSHSHWLLPSLIPPMELTLQIIILVLERTRTIKVSRYLYDWADANRLKYLTGSLIAMFSCLLILKTPCQCWVWCSWFGMPNLTLHT